LQEEEEEHQKIMNGAIARGKHSKIKKMKEKYGD
jgi:hypothetical protein